MSLAICYHFLSAEMVSLLWMKQEIHKIRGSDMTDLQMSDPSSGVQSTHLVVRSCSRWWPKEHLLSTRNKNNWATGIDHQQFLQWSPVHVYSNRAIMKTMARKFNFLLLWIMSHLRQARLKSTCIYRFVYHTPLVNGPMQDIRTNDATQTRRYVCRKNT